MCWSGGKDSALALHGLVRDGRYDVAGLVTTVTRDYGRISMHGVRRELLHAQAAALDLPLTEALIARGASNGDYEAAMAKALGGWRTRGVGTVAFGDLFLADIRAYRERQMAALGLDCLFPVWGQNTTELAHRFINDGFRARICCVDPRQIAPDLCGREFDRELLNDLPAAADPCGENGEFHTFVYDGPDFSAPIELTCGDVVSRDGFCYCDLIPHASGRPLQPA
jgi:uncharacterized protein (TIGR00290 family)